LNEVAGVGHGHMIIGHYESINFAQLIVINEKNWMIQGGLTEYKGLNCKL